MDKKTVEKYLKEVVKVTDKNWIAKLFSSEVDWGEDESIFVEGLGFLKYSIEDDAGTVTIFMGDKELNKFSYEDDDWDKIGAKVICKLGFYGSWGNEEGKGYFCTNLSDNTYKDIVKFKTYEEGYTLLEKYLVTKK